MRASASWIRLTAAVAAGGVAALATLVGNDVWLSLSVGWITTSLIFCGWTWLAIAPMDPAETRRHATREDPSRFASSVLLIIASLAALIGVGVMLIAGSQRHGSVPLEAIVGVGAVLGSWVIVHTEWATHYARLYFDSDIDKPIDFNASGDPDYQDFAYLAFTLGMTYQVSDTTINDRRVRRSALRHALLSFVLGAGVLACTINLVVQLASGTG